MIETRLNKAISPPPPPTSRNLHFFPVSSSGLYAHLRRRFLEPPQTWIADFSEVIRKRLDWSKIENATYGRQQTGSWKFQEEALFEITLK